MEYSWAKQNLILLFIVNSITILSFQNNESFANDVDFYSFIAFYKFIYN